MTYFATKYNNARDEILHVLVGDSSWVSTSGDSEAPTGWFGAISIESDEDVFAVLEYVGSVLGEDGTNDLLRELDNGEGDLKGHWLLSGDGLGFCYVTQYPSEGEMACAVNALDEQYGEWLGDEEDGE